MRFWHIVLPILVGSLIGYCTNYIAIRMLFRPHKAVYIHGHQLPFTPGIIPKNQKRVARAAGEAVAEQLLTKDAVLKNLGDAGEKAVSRIAAGIRESSTSLIDVFPEKEKAEELIDSVSAAAADSLMKKADQVDLEAVIAKYGREAVGSLLVNTPMLAMLLNSETQNLLYHKLAVSARQYIDTRGETVVRDFVSSWVREMAEKPIRDIVPDEEKQNQLQAALEGAIRAVIEKHGADFLDLIDAQGIITERIEAMDMDELEELVMSVMKQELQAVINLGALIGALIGTINIFL